MASHRISVPEGAASERLDAWLAAQEGLGSRAQLERLIAAGAVQVDGRARPKGFRLAGGEVIDVELPTYAPPEPEELGVDVRYDDEHLLVVEKPAGIVTHPTTPGETGTLVHGLLRYGPRGGDPERPGIVHRLDRDTSGLLLVARSDEAFERLQEAIRRRQVERAYTALVTGVPQSRTGRIEASVGRDRTDPQRHSLDTDTPRSATTWFETLERLGPRTLLELRLETGRTHQIRVHLEAIGLPVCGDPLYGRPGDLGLTRQFLHAHRLAFTHPVSRERIEITSPLPADLAAALDLARSP